MRDYLYLFGAVALAPLFFYVSRERPDLRRRLWLIGLSVGVAGLVIGPLFSDYWRPPELYQLKPLGGLEDFLFGFFWGGLGSVFYEAFLQEKVRDGKPHHYWMLPVLVVSELTFLWLGPRLGINSILASSLGFLAPTVVIVAIRRDLLHAAIFSGLVFGGLIFLVEGVLLAMNPGWPDRYFLLLRSVPQLGNVPVTEIIWMFSAGAVTATIYEFSAGKRFVAAPEDPPDTR